MSKAKSPSREFALFIGDGVAARRRELGMTQAELGELAGLDANAVGRIERGEHDSSIVALSTLYLHLDCGGVFVAPEGIVPIPSGIEGFYLTPETLCQRPPSMVMGMSAACRGRRSDYGLSMENLAREIGVHHNTIWYFEKGLVSPGSFTYFRLLRRLEVAQVTVRGNRVSFGG